MDSTHNVQPVEIEPQTVNKQPVKPVKKRSAWSTVAFLFALLMLVAAGAFAWSYYMWKDTQKQLTAKQSEIAAAQTQINGLREQLGIATGKAQAEATLPTNDESLITDAVKSYNGSLASPLADSKVTIAQRTETQALANVANSTASYKVYLKKASNKWVVVWSGTGTPAQDVIDRYGLKISS